LRLRAGLFVVSLSGVCVAVYEPVGVGVLFALETLGHAMYVAPALLGDFGAVATHLLNYGIGVHLYSPAAL
jgi:hypothetical protein